MLTLAQIEEVVQKEKVQVKLRAQEKTDGWGNQQVQPEQSEDEDEQDAGGDTSMILGGGTSSNKKKICSRREGERCRI